MAGRRDAELAIAVVAAVVVAVAGVVLTEVVDGPFLFFVSLPRAVAVDMVVVVPVADDERAAAAAVAVVLRRRWFLWRRPY
jgi:hypothetical protein